VEVVASLSQGRTAAAQCGLFTHKSVPVIFEPPCRLHTRNIFESQTFRPISQSVEVQIRKFFLVYYALRSALCLLEITNMGYF